MNKLMPEPLESDIQIQVVSYLTLCNIPGLVFFAVPNEAMSKARTMGGIARMVRLKKMGLRSGVADLCFVYSGKVYFLELKRRLKKQTVNQLAFEADAIRAGAEYAVADSFDVAMMVLRKWGIITTS